MPSKFDRLRSGEVVEIEPGRKGRLNLEKKTFETSDGRTMFVGDDPDFFPSNEEALKVSREKESLERGIKKTPAGEFLYQFGNQGIAGAAKDTMNKIMLKGDDYIRSKKVNSEVSDKISDRSPWTSAGATAASLIPDIALTRGMSALKAGPVLAAAHAGPRIVEEPTQVATEALFSAAGGHLIDKGAAALNRIAQRRGAIRAMPGQQAAVREQNALGQQAVNDANNLQNQQFNALKQNVKSVNEARLNQHQTDLTNRQNKMIQDQNAFETAKTVRDAEVIRLKNAAEMAKAQRSADQAVKETEYRIAKEAAESENKRFAEQFKLQKAQHEQALRELPEVQRKAQAEYSENVVKNAEGISNAFPKDSKIYSSQFGTSNFIDESINKSALAGSREAGQATRILKSIMPEGEILTAKDLSTRYKALEGAIQKSSPEVAAVLNDFKAHMGMKLNTVLADNMAYARVMPTLKSQIIKDVHASLDSMGFKPQSTYSLGALKRRVDGNLNQLFREMTPEDFMRKFRSGEIREHFLKNIITADDFTAFDLSQLNKLVNNKSFGKFADPAKRKNLTALGVVDGPSADLQKFSSVFNSKLDNALAKAELKMIATDVDATTKLGGKVKKTFGMAEPVPPPNAPMAPEGVPMPMQPADLPQVPPVQMPAPINPPQQLPMPAKPNLMSNPNQPTPQAFNPIPEPSLAPAQGIMEGAGDLLEKNLMGGNTLTNNPIAKLAGLKYLMGKAALPAELAYMGMKGLTSPTAGGQVARMTFKQGGIQAIDAWAQKYPSYQNGILQNPQERRSFTKEIEDDAEIPPEQKAILQSKVNRGKPLSAPL